MARKRIPILHPVGRLFPLLGENELQELADDRLLLTRPPYALNCDQVTAPSNRLAFCLYDRVASVILIRDDRLRMEM